MSAVKLGAPTPKNSASSLGSGAGGGGDNEQLRKTLFDHLVAFYLKADHDRLLAGDVDIDGICDWVIGLGPNGVDLLNDNLRKKYGEDLDSFLVIEEEDEEEGEGDEEEGDGDEEGSGEDEKPPAATVATGNGPPPIVPRRSDMRTPSITGLPAQTHTEPSAPVPEPFPGEEGGGNASTAAALARPTIPVARRRPTNQRNITLDENGNVVTKDDTPVVPDLRSQLAAFLRTHNAEEKTDEMFKLASQHGMVALNSELLARFGEDLKGNTVSAGESSGAAHDPKAFGVGDSKLIQEIASHGLRELRHEDSGRVVIESETGVCSKFRLDTTSPVFGMCRCGHKREEHVAKRSSLASGSLQRKLDVKRKEADGGGSAPPPPGAAAPFAEVPIPAAPAKPPPPPATAATTTTTTTKRSSKKRPGSKGKTGADGIERLGGGSGAPKQKAASACPAEEFKLDMGAKTFGTCAQCGWHKSEHKPGGGGASAPAAPKPPAPPRPMSIKANGPTEPCSNYRLDVNAESFGACVCGFPRAAHAGQASIQNKVHNTLEKKWGEMQSVRSSLKREKVKRG